MKTQAGFSLVELMIAMVIMVILAGLALPSYNQYVLRAQRGIAQQLIADIRSRQERYFLNNRGYANNLTDLGFATASINIDKQGNAGASTADAIYTLSLTNTSATTWTLQAVPKNGQLKDTDCGTLSMNHTGLRSASGNSGSACWQ